MTCTKYSALCTWHSLLHHDCSGNVKLVGFCHKPLLFVLSEPLPLLSRLVWLVWLLDLPPKPFPVTYSVGCIYRLYLSAGVLTLFKSGEEEAHSLTMYIVFIERYNMSTERGEKENYNSFYCLFLSLSLSLFPTKCKAKKKYGNNDDRKTWRFWPLLPTEGTHSPLLQSLHTFTYICLISSYRGTSLIHHIFGTKWN